MIGCTKIRVLVELTKILIFVLLTSVDLLRRVQDLNLRAGISRFAGFRVRCITTLPTLQMVLE